VKFYDSDNEADLADCILQLRRDHELRKQLVSNATRYIQKNNWRVRQQEYLDLVIPWSLPDETDNNQIVRRPCYGNPISQTKYIIISSVKDEEKYIETTIHAVLRQTARPSKWVIVDDGSGPHPFHRG